MIFVDWIGWQFLDVFVSYFVGIQVGIWNQDFATTDFFGMLRKSLCRLLKVAFLSVLAKHHLFTQKAEGRLIDEHKVF